MAERETELSQCHARLLTMPSHQRLGQVLGMQLPSSHLLGWEAELQEEPRLEELHFGSFLTQRGDSSIALSAKSAPVGSYITGSSPSLRLMGSRSPSAHHGDP